MRTTPFLAATLAAVARVSAQETPDMANAPLLPANIFQAQPKFAAPIPLKTAANIFKNVTGSVLPEVESVVGPITGLVKTAATIAGVLKRREEKLESRAGNCNNPRVRIEWDSYSNNDKQSYINAIKCLMGRGPSGQFSASRSRYEDLVALHQTLTPNVHGNDKFLIWHRYLLWTFEDVLRQECGFQAALPWFDETKYAGRFGQSSVFSSQWFGSFRPNGGCVTDGQFANLAINIGPGSGNSRHCISRAGDESASANCNQAYVNQCNAWGDYHNMAQCAEGGPHAWGHNGIGGVMADTFASPSDPVFWLHHAFIDRNYRIWQNQNSARIQGISGTDSRGNQLSMGTTVNVYDIRPTVRIRDIIDTTNTALCYKYQY